MNMDLICLLAVWFTNIIILLAVIFLLVQLNRIQKEKLNLEQLKFNFDYEPKETDFNIIETLIQENLAEYRINKLESVEKLYINENIQKKIFEYVLRKTMYQISPIYLQKLSYIYNKNNYTKNKYVYIRLYNRS